MPAAFSDSISDNTNPFIAGTYFSFYLFWERMTGESVSQILFRDYYTPSEPTEVISANGYQVTNPQAVLTDGWWPYSDTVAFVFYQSDEPGNFDIFYKVMMNTGSLSDPIPFAITAEEETHMRVSQGGGMVWLAGDKVCFTRLRRDQSGFFFDPVVTIDSGQCRMPVIANTSDYMPEEYIAWEKGGEDSPEIWYSQWGWGSGQWSPPVLLFGDGRHSNPVLSKSMFWFPIAQLLSDYQDDSDQYHISAYDFYSQEEYISELSQPAPLQPDLFSMDIPTAEYPANGFMTFSFAGVGEEYDIFCNDYGQVFPWIGNYCFVDSNNYPERNPRLFQGAEWGDCFDLILVWEAFRNGHWQLFASTTLVIIGGMEDKTGSTEMKVSTSPNPFLATTKLNFELDEPAVVVIRIFDSFGRLLIDYGERNYSAGSHEEIISLPGLPSGTYLLQVVSNHFYENKIIVKGH